MMVSPLSNYGSEISVSAPGVGIYSTQPGNSYDTDNGTSFSAPQVAGLAALVLSLHRIALSGSSTEDD